MAAPAASARRRGSQNAHKHGFFSRAAIAERRRINGFIRKCLQTLREVDETLKT